MGDARAGSPPPSPRRTWALPSPLRDSFPPSGCSLGVLGKGRGGNHRLLAAVLFLGGLGLALAGDVWSPGWERRVRR